jgi:4'-phosphopantetheinyl transferase
MKKADLAWGEPPADLALAPGEVHVWCAALDRPAGEVRALARLLSTDERDRAERFHFERDRARFVAGRATLRLILAGYTHAGPEGLVLRQGRQGKPALVGEPGALAEAGALHFNVSHSEGVALYAFALGRQVGVDVEHVRPVDDAEQIAARFFSPAECAALAMLPPDARLQAFFTCWTRKEAYVKAIGEGLSRPLEGFAVSLAPGEAAALLHVEGDPDEARRWRLEALAPAQDYVGALAAEGHGWRLACWRFTDGARIGRR